MSKCNHSLWVYIQSNGDGSGAPKFFNTEDAAEEYASQCEESTFDNDISEVELEFDKDGNVEEPVHWDTGS